MNTVGRFARGAFRGALDGEDINTLDAGFLGAFNNELRITAAAGDYD